MSIIERRSPPGPSAVHYVNYQLYAMRGYRVVPPRLHGWRRALVNLALGPPRQGVVLHD